MRILTCRFKNLNSLAGESPVINFHNGILGEAGIFAITGPTGAGKTTILDAICLALYGMTPRLKKGSEVREVMTRHTGESWSEVEFEVNGKVYRGRWDVHRARNRADGKLQSPQMELVSLDGDESTIIASGLKLVPERVSELTGLDSERFFRSIMLAQGDFAAFLESGPKGRAELLEKMTGTEIYAEISVAVYQRWALERDKLDRLKLESDAAELMDEPAFAALESKLQDQEKELAVVVEERKRLQLVRTWLETLTLLEKQIAAHANDLEELVEEEKVAQPQLERLTNHARALPLKDSFTAVESKGAYLAAQVKANDALTTEIEQLAVKKDALKAELAKAEKGWQTFSDERKQIEDQIPAIVQKQEQLREIEQRLKSLGREAAEGESRVADLKARLAETAAERARVETALAEANAYLEAHATDRALQSELALLKSKLTQLAAVRGTEAQVEVQFNACVLRSEEVRAACRKAEESLAAVRKELDKDRSRRDELAVQLEKTLAGGDIDGLAKLVDQHQERQVELDAAVRTAREMVNAKGEQERLAAEEAKHSAAIEAMKATCERGQITCTEVERVIEELETQQKRELLIGKHADERKRLKPGEPCPLCGAHEHPWAERSPEIGGAEAELKAQIKVLRKLQKEVAGYQAQRAGLEATLAETIKQRETGATRLAQLTVQWEGLRKVLPAGQDWQDPDAIEAFASGERVANDDRRKMLGVVRAMQKDLDVMGLEMAALERRSGELEVQVAKLVGEAKLASEEMGRIERQRSESTSESAVLSRDLEVSLEPLQLTLPEPGAEQELAVILDARATVFMEKHELVQSLAPQVSLVTERIATQTANLAELQKGCDATATALAEAEKLQARLGQERAAMFDGRSVDQLRADLQKQEDEKQELLRKARAESIATEEGWKSKQELLLRQEKSVATLNAELETALTAFRKARGAAGFVSDEAFGNALLSTDEFSVLDGLSRGLQKRRTEAETRLEDARAQLVREREKQISEEELGVVVAAEKAAEVQEQDARDVTSESRAAIRRQVEMRKQQGERVEQIKAQQIEFDRWSRLNHLIGSASGDKFRRFAQGLTLDRLISLANERLSRFSDRYTLLRSEEEELDVLVVDAYQADAVRPTATLSGGERFLVSLALALGLSELSARRTHIDSLFMDEGFGTLDTETLEIALAALHNVRSSGKTIGIISHVDALKERIPVQIRVNRLSGGLSELEVVGYDD